MEWDTWTHTLPYIMEKTPHWKKYFETFYVVNPLHDPIVLKERYTLVEKQIQDIDIFTNEYNSVIAKIKSFQIQDDTHFEAINELCFSAYYRMYDTMSTFKEIIPKMCMINSFYFCVPSKSFELIQIPAPLMECKKLSIDWDLDFYSEFQIKISHDSNFTLHILSAQLQYKVLRYNGCILYFFERHTCGSEGNICVEFTLTVENKSNVCGTLAFGFNQDVYKTSDTKTTDALNEIENKLDNLRAYKAELIERRSLVQNEIEQYKSLFDEKLKACIWQK